MKLLGKRSLGRLITLKYNIKLEIMETSCEHGRWWNRLRILINGGLWHQQWNRQLVLAEVGYTSSLGYAIIILIGHQ
jgi:hypothetical protein